MHVHSRWLLPAFMFAWVLSAGTAGAQQDVSVPASDGRLELLVLRDGLAMVRWHSPGLSLDSRGSIAGSGNLGVADVSDRTGISRVEIASPASEREMRHISRQDTGRQSSRVPYGSTLLHPGDRVRVHTVSRSAKFVGTVTAVDETTITLEPDGDGQPTVLHREDITTLDVSAGKSSRGKHALIGAVIGGGLGAVMGFAVGDDPGSHNDTLEDAAFKLTRRTKFMPWSAADKALMLGVSFAVVGTVVGLVLPAGEQWQKVPMNSRLSIEPAHGSVGYSLVYRF